MYDAPWARGIVGKQVSVEGMAQQTRNGHSASAAEVAALAGVSRQTVSRVVNGVPNVTEKTRKRVLAAMEELGFRPNFAGAALRGGSYRSIGLCMYNITRVGNPRRSRVSCSGARARFCRHYDRDGRRQALYTCRCLAPHGRATRRRHDSQHEPHGSRF